MEGIDAVVTDPPYGVALKARVTKHTVRAGEYSAYDDTPENVAEQIIPRVQLCIDRFSRVVVTPGVRMMFAYPKPDDVGCIFTPEGAGVGKWGFTCMSPILYYGKSPYTAKGLGSRPTAFEIHATAEQNGHPCPKPVRWMTRLVVTASLDGDTILDPFTGSGTTGVACVNTGRRFIGIEIDQGYCDIAVKRIKDALAQGRLFATDAP